MRYEIPKPSPSTVNHAALLVAVSSLVLPTQEYRPSSFALNSLVWEQSQPRTFCHLSVLVSLQSLFTKEPVNIQGRNQLWVGGEDTLQGGFFALLDREVGRVLNHPCSLQNNQVLKRDEDVEEGFRLKRVKTHLRVCCTVQLGYNLAREIP